MKETVVVCLVFTSVGNYNFVFVDVLRGWLSHEGQKISFHF